MRRRRLKSTANSVSFRRCRGSDGLALRSALPSQAKVNWQARRRCLF